MSGKRLSSDTEITDLLKLAKRVAVVGASAKPERMSHKIFAYLLQQGIDAIPVNPAGGEILGVSVARSLRDINGSVDIVDVFRNPKDLEPSIVDDCIAIGAKALWLQDGVVREDIAAKAVQAGLWVVMDDCIYRRHANIGYCAI